MHKPIRKIIEKEENWELLIEKWNEMYPNNKVKIEEDEDDPAVEEDDGNSRNLRREATRNLDTAIERCPVSKQSQQSA